MLISNSEVRSFNSCERKHYYSFRERLKPIKSLSKAITIGVTGHSALETYYSCKLKGDSLEDCKKQALDRVDQAKVEYPELDRELSHLTTMLTWYIDFYKDETWVPVLIEHQLDTLLDNSTVYGMRLDLLVDNKGSMILVDHKFVYNFFSEREEKMAIQMHKYLYTLNKAGFPVQKAILNQIRYRPLKDPKPEDVFKRSLIVSSPYEQAQIMIEHIKTAHKIQDLKALPKQEHFNATTMNLDKSCGLCSFQPLCKAHLQGIDSTKTKEILYKENDYLYDGDINESAS